MPDEILPPDVHTSTVWVCTSRPRACHGAELQRCSSCGWWGSPPDEGESLDLFAVQHDDELCARRQREPQWAREQDRARLEADGVTP